MGKLGDWIAGQESWVGDAPHRAALAGVATADDAETIAARVQAAKEIGWTDHLNATRSTSLPCCGRRSRGVPLLCSIGPLGHVDRLAPGEELKFPLDGLTIIFRENGSGKSGYARAARRLPTFAGQVHSEPAPAATAIGTPTEL